MEKCSKIYVAGNRGMVGSAIVRKLEKEGFSNLIFRTSKELNLTDQEAVAHFFETEKPEYVFLAATILISICIAHFNTGNFSYGIWFVSLF